MTDARSSVEAGLRRRLAADRNIDPEALEVDLTDELAPGWRAFRAGTGQGEHSDWWSGVVGPDPALILGPEAALRALIEQWTATGAPPDARRFAEAVSVLYDAAARHQAVLSALDQESLDAPALPQVFEDRGGWGVTFWWTGPRGPSRVRVRVAPDGRLLLSEQT
jgi:hypothetical protein